MISNKNTTFTFITSFNHDRLNINASLYFNRLNLFGLPVASVNFQKNCIKNSQFSRSKKRFLLKSLSKQPSFTLNGIKYFDSLFFKKKFYKPFSHFVYCPALNLNDYYLNLNENFPVNQDEIYQLFFSIRKFQNNNGIPYWHYGYCNASQVLKNCTKFTNIYDMLTEVVFINNLCLHDKINEDYLTNNLGIEDWQLREYAYCKSNKTRLSYFKTLDISKINYNTFVLSAVCFLAKRLLFNKSISKSQIIISFIRKISKVFLLSSPLNIFICKFLKNSGFCRIFQNESVYGMQLELGSYFYPGYKSNLFLDSSTYFSNYFKNIENIKNLSYFLTSLDIFPNKFISNCLSDCVKVSNFIPIYLVLLLYRYNLNIISNEEFLKQKNFLIDSRWLKVDFIKKYENFFLDSEFLFFLDSSLTIKNFNEKLNKRTVIEQDKKLNFSEKHSNVRFLNLTLTKIKETFKVKLKKITYILLLFGVWFLMVGSANAMQQRNLRGNRVGVGSVGASFSRRQMPTINEASLHDSSLSLPVIELQMRGAGPSRGLLVSAARSEISETLGAEIPSQAVFQEPKFAVQYFSVAHTPLQKYVDAGWLLVCQYIPISGTFTNAEKSDFSNRVIYSSIPCSAVFENTQLKNQIKAEIQKIEVKENRKYKNILDFFGIYESEMEIDHTFGIFERKATYLNHETASGVLMLRIWNKYKSQSLATFADSTGPDLRLTNPLNNSSACDLLSKSHSQIHANLLRHIKTNYPEVPVDIIQFQCHHLESVCKGALARDINTITQEFSARKVNFYQPISAKIMQSRFILQSFNAANLKFENYKSRYQNSTSNSLMPKNEILGRFAMGQARKYQIGVSYLKILEIEPTAKVCATEFKNNLTASEKETSNLIDIFIRLNKNDPNFNILIANKTVSIYSSEIQNPEFLSYEQICQANSEDFDFGLCVRNRNGENIDYTLPTKPKISIKGRTLRTKETIAVSSQSFNMTNIHSSTQDFFNEQNKVISHDLNLGNEEFEDSEINPFTR